MRILVINSGSSTVKFDLLEVTLNQPASGAAQQPPRRVAGGVVDRIGHEPTSSIEFAAASGLEEKREAVVKDHHEAVSAVLEWLRSASEHDADLKGGIDAVGHRVVHGGDRFVDPTLINPQVLATLEELSELAPLHNPAALQGIKAAQEVLGPQTPMVAVFDTAFHATLPDYAYTYAIPYEMAQRLHIRRYGFHGLAHQFMLRRYSQLLGMPIEQATLITLQLGNGCSAAAIKNGLSVDTSMGFTPVEGLVMGTRSGDIDPGVISYLAEKEGITAEDADTLLNKRSGMLGISGRSSDMRDLLATMPTDPRARLAVDVFCYRIRKYIGAYMAVLEGAQAIIFGGGIGEHAPYIRASICRPLEWCGLRLDAQRNEAALGGESIITVDDSRVRAYVVPVDEAILIGEYVASVVSDQRSAISDQRSVIGYLGDKQDPSTRTDNRPPTADR